MSFQDNKPTKAHQDSEEHDGYDYLDSLMQDVMGPEDTELADDSSADKQYEDSSPILEQNDYYEDDYDEETNEQGTPIKSKRVPLFQQLKNKETPKVESESTHADTSSPEIADVPSEIAEDYEQEKEVQTERAPVRRRGLLSGLGKPVVKDDEPIEQQSAPEIEETEIVDVPSETASSPEIAREQEVYEDEDHLDEDSVPVNDFIDDSEESFSDYENDDEEEQIESKSTDQLDDMFDGMLSDLTELVDDEGGPKSTKEDNSEPSDNDVSIPLNKPGMEDIKVTPDGRSLADMIPGLRSGAKPVNDVVASIKSQEKVVEVGNKKFSDDRYIKHVKEVEDKRKEQDKRRALSNKFLQRNAKFSEQEKIIMNNLGVSNEQFAKLMGSKELTKKQKEEIIGLGKYGAEKFFKGRRYRTTVGDSAILEYLAKFKFANTRILRWISNEPQGRTWRKLNRLRDNGLVEDKAIIGVPNLWAATPAGIALSGYSFTPGLRPMPKMITISSTMGVNYLAACLWFNTVNVLNLDDFPANNRVIPTQEDGRDRARGEMLVSELEIRSSLGKEIAPGSTTMQTLGEQRLYDVISATVRQEFKQWDEGGRVGESPEFSLGNEFMWVLYPVGELTMAYHVPDLVVRRDRGPNGEPRSIAVEVERSEKDSSRYDKIMRAYKLDDSIYEKVIWVTPNTRIARALEKSAKDVGFENYEIVPIITETGVFNKPDIWMI